MIDNDLKKLIDQKVEVKYNLTDEHIFLVTAWTDTLEKQRMLVRCIKKLKEFNIQILLSVNYPVIEEIQKLVDYYIFHNKNEILPFEEFESVGIYSHRQTTTSSYNVINWEKYNHHYAVLSNIKKSFLYCDIIHKKKIHYVEFDCEIDTKQYYQTFIKEIEHYDFVIKPTIWSIRIEVALKMINEISDSMYDHYKKTPYDYHNYFSDGLSPYEFSYIRKYTDKIKISFYIDNNKTLNLNAIHNDRNKILNGVEIPQILLAVHNNNIFTHFISKQSVLLEIKYNNNNKFIKINPYDLIDIGEYIKNEVIIIRLFGIEIFRSVLDEDISSFRSRNYIEFKNK